MRAHVAQGRRNRPAIASARKRQLFIFFVRLQVRDVL